MKRSRIIHKRNLHKLEEHVNSDIKVGDKVKFHDGSALSCDKVEDKSIFIVDSCPGLTGVSDKLKHIKGEVIETGIENRGINIPFTGDEYYLQDIVVKLGEGEFRTASKFVYKIEE